MRFVGVKSEEKQAAGIVFRTRDLLVRQRTQAINAIRGHLAEFSIVAAKGPFHVIKLTTAIEDDPSSLPELARPDPSCARGADAIAGSEGGFA